MKRSRKDVLGKVSKALNVQFDQQPLTLFAALACSSDCLSSSRSRKNSDFAFATSQEIPPTNIISSSCCSSSTDFSAFVTCATSTTTTTTIWSSARWA